MEVLGGHLEVPSAQLAATNGYSDIARGNPEAPKWPQVVIQGPFKSHMESSNGHQMTPASHPEAANGYPMIARSQ